MDISVSSASPEKIKTGILAVGVFVEGALTGAAKAIDAAAGGKIAAKLKRGDLEENTGATLMLHDLPGVAAERVLLVSLGKREDFGDRTLREALTGGARVLAASNAADAVVCMADGEIAGRSLTSRVQLAARVLADGAYKFDAPRAKKSTKVRGVKKVTLLVAGKVDKALEAAAKNGVAIAEGMALTKDLGNLGGNVCNPGYLASTAKALGKEFKFKVEVLERADMEKLGMGSLLSVGRASYSPCKFIIMKYDGGAKGAKPVVLVGKGITFDTGGISLKPGALLDEMKYDMCGAGSVIGVFKTLARLKLPLNVVGLVPAVENMPGGNASRPGDVVTSMSGITVEILNTDAEGRLILNDALTYAERFDPACVIDIATLTGACVIALGAHASGLLANDDGLAAELLKCGIEAGDRAWQLPLWEEYMSQLKSNFADMSNLGGPPGGTITAALFLSKFAKKYRWAHLDIAGTSSVGGDAKGATGRPVPLLAQFLIERSAKAAT
jgi:leucyl aminopeptidase